MAKTFKDYLQEAVVASKYHCKDCGDTMHKPTTDCSHDSHDEKGSHWIDNNGNGINDMDEGFDVSEGPFKGVGKTLMKRKLDKQYKKSDLANFDNSGIDTSGKTPDEIRQMKSDYYHDHMDKADKAKKAKNRLSREEMEIDRIKELAGASIDETYDDDDDFYNAYGEMWYNEDEIMDEAEYQGRKVKLGKPMQGDVKKFKVYVKDPKTGNVKKVNFGHGGSSVKGKAMSIKKNNPKRRKSFRARHNCDNPGPRTKARYWSCRKW